MSNSYSIVLPAYNESERLKSSLPQVLEYVRRRGGDAEIIVVNDGSRDNTAEIVRTFAATDSRVHLLENPGNRGKGYSVRNGVLHAHGEIVLFSDSDLSSPIQEADKLFVAIESGADVAIGSRWLQSELQTERQPILRQLYGRLFNLLLRVVLGLKFLDTQCGFKAFKRQAAHIIFSRQHIERWGFDPEILFLAKKFKLRTVEIPVQWAHDHRSKINPLRDGFRMGMEVLKIRAYDIQRRYEHPSIVVHEPKAADVAPHPVVKDSGAVIRN